jgi:hypothetical protein
LGFRGWVGKSDIIERNVTFDLRFFTLILLHFGFVLKHIEYFLYGGGTVDDVGVAVGNAGSVIG